VNSSFEQLDNDEQKLEEWYDDSDTSQEIPDPNYQDEPLYQKAISPPVDLTKKYFEEGLVHVITLKKQRESPKLVMHMETRQNDFTYRTFFVRGSSRGTFHGRGRNKNAAYEDVFRLAPRDELVLKVDVRRFFVGQTEIFVLNERAIYNNYSGCKDVSDDKSYYRMWKEPGYERFHLYEIVSCHEIFGSSLLHGLLKKVYTPDLKMDRARHRKPHSDAAP